MFVDGHERLNVVEDCKWFMKMIKEMELYLVEFRENDTIKDKNYSLDCAVGGENRRSIIVITHDECTFLANNDIQKA